MSDLGYLFYTQIRISFFPLPVSGYWYSSDLLQITLKALPGVLCVAASQLLEESPKHT